VKADRFHEVLTVGNSGLLAEISLKSRIWLICVNDCVRIRISCRKAEDANVGTKIQNFTHGPRNGVKTVAIFYENLQQDEASCRIVWEVNTRGVAIDHQRCRNAKIPRSPQPNTESVGTQPLAQETGEARWAESGQRWRCVQLAIPYRSKVGDRESLT
jgi:hypothetical protein